MAFDALKEETAKLNRQMHAMGLAGLNRGAISVVDREAGVLAIRPAGPSPAELEPGQIVVVGLLNLQVQDEAPLPPDPMIHTHVFLANVFGETGGIASFASPHALGYSILRRDLLPYSSTHAEHFLGPVPCARSQSPNEVAYEFAATIGVTIQETFEARGADYREIPGAFLPGAGAVCWGPTGAAALGNASALEESAQAAYIARTMSSDFTPLSEDVVRAHFFRARGEAG